MVGGGGGGGGGGGVVGGGGFAAAVVINCTCWWILRYDTSSFRTGQRRRQAQVVLCRSFLLAEELRDFA